MPSMASNYAFHFHLALNFRLCTVKNAPASVERSFPDSLPGLRSGPHWGTSVPKPPDLPRQLHLLDPPLTVVLSTQ